MPLKALLSVLLAALTGIAVFYGYPYFRGSSTTSDQSPLFSASQPQVWKGKATGTPLVGGSFSLIDHQGHRKTDVDFKGRFMIIYFGYADCPDMCPMALGNISTALEALGSQANEFQPLFITLDPESDRPEKLAKYMESYHSSFVALTGTPQEIAQAAKSYRVYWAKNKDESLSSGYVVDHSSVIYVMDRQGRFVTSFNHTTEPEKIRDLLEKVL